MVLTAFVGGVGYVLRVWAAFDPTPLLLGFVLSRPLEENLHRALLFSNGDPTTFVTHPVSAALVGITIVLVVLGLLPAVRRRRAAT